MNFLGHFVLAGEDEGLLIGNFIADFVKGKEYENYPEPIAAGIMMHREIDYFTDQHDTFRMSKRRILENQGHFSGVVMDVFYDHFLARDFEQLTGFDLSKFAEETYSVIEKYTDQIPEMAKFVFGYMKRDNWLLRYRHKEGINRTLRGMSKRVKFENNMDQAISDLEDNYNSLRQDFHHFIKEARNYFS